MADIADPTPGSRDVVVKVLASTINIDDIHVAEGTFYGGIPISSRPSPRRPITPGSDFAGLVTGIGSRVGSVRVGDAVFGVHVPYRARGAWAELCIADERWMTAKPKNLPFTTAAACGVSGLVAFSAVQALALRPGLRVVIVGATGGIGGMAVQLAVRAGAEVIGVCGSGHADSAMRLGCSSVLDYRNEPWDRQITKRGGAPIDRVLDVVGGCDVEAAARRVLRADGAFVTVVGPERFIGDRRLGWIGVLRVLGRITYRLISSRIRGPRYILTGPTTGKQLADVAEAASAGVMPPIDSTVSFQLEPMRQALRRAAAHQNEGRIVIDMTRAC